MKKYTNIGKATLERLPLYFHAIKKMRDDGVTTISSIELGYRTGNTGESVRSDFALLGYFGKRGVGYSVDQLLARIGETLGHKESWNMVVIGKGYPIANYYSDFFPASFNLVGVFDLDCKKVGKRLPELKTRIYPFEQLEEMSRTVPIHTGVIAVTAEYAQKVANKLVVLGVVGICNLSPVTVWVPETVTLINNNIAASLSSLSHSLHRENFDERYRKSLGL